MLTSEPTFKRSSSSPLGQSHGSDVKKLKRPYHHHHRLQNPVIPATSEPAITDASSIDHLMSRSIGFSLRENGFDLADPVALDSFRNAAEEYFEHALKRHSLRVDDLIPHVKTIRDLEPTPTLLPSPPPEDDSFKTLPSLGPRLSGEDDRVRSAHIPKHFPEFPSKHTYRHTPVFTEREQDPRKIRERATEDGRHGEEALRKLARAAFKDNQLGSSGRDKKSWGRRTESMDSMFEKTVKELLKKTPKPATVPGLVASMEIDSGAAPDTEIKLNRSKTSLSIELPPIINCERDLWRKSTVSRDRRPEEKTPGVKDTSGIPRVESWVGT
ncbi:hypothetical protein EYZ11_008237 [Aspergillus tanneri]|uniref:Transcription initiation factor TFIID subunit 8 n=1 Tax=Aspergillus tanneri TaxID=1220188 RepID=A0A4S3JD38_9EURO|nr:hypothetical protein EYZ11_008237 [Aspergillus tanneri]